MLISIIIPCYNIEKYIEKTILSVLGQTCKNFELILINDGSTDKTLEILKKYEMKDDRIKVIDQSNKGVSSARNKGIEESRGDYIYFLDGDDLIESELLKNATDIFKKNKELEVFSFNFKLVSEDLKETRVYNFENHNKKIFTGQNFLKLLLKKQMRQSICSVIIKKEMLIKNNIWFNEKYYYAEDQDFQIRSLLNTLNIYYDSKVYFYYINRKTSVMNKSINENWLKSLEVIYSLKDLSKENKIEKEFTLYLYYFYFYMLRRIIKERSIKGIRYMLKNSYVLNPLIQD